MTDFPSSTVTLLVTVVVIKAASMARDVVGDKAVDVVVDIALDVVVAVA